MTDLITDKSRKPTQEELGEYIANPLFQELCGHMESVHKALTSIDYSGDKVLLGWNLRFRKGGRTLLRLYPRRGYFAVLLVIGPKERQRAEALLPELSEQMRQLYADTKEGMGQRWMVTQLHSQGPLYEDILKLAALRRG